MELFTDAFYLNLTNEIYFRKYTDKFCKSFIEPVFSFKNINV